MQTRCSLDRRGTHALVAATLAVTLGFGGLSDRAGAQATPTDSVMWSAHLTTSGRYACGATVIDRVWVLTARHCVEPLCGESDDQKLTALKVRLDDRSGGSVQSDVRSVRCPATTATGQTPDIALVEIAWHHPYKKKADRRRPVLGTAFPEPAAEPAARDLWAPLWLDSTGKPRGSTELALRQPLSKEACRLAVQQAGCDYLQGAWESQACVLEPDGSPPGQPGDSGGGVARRLGARDAVLGVASWRCPAARLGGYEVVARHRDWILKEACGWYWGADDRQACRDRLSKP